MPGKKSKIAINIPEIKLTKEEIEKWKFDNEEAKIERKKKQNESPKDDRVGECVVCNSKIIAKITSEYLGDFHHMIIGPGSRQQMTTIHHGFHCTKCGLKYEFPPQK
jgi:3-polyprenyl-4-hydroxybenzoate decarboxylase